MPLLSGELKGESELRVSGELGGYIYCEDLTCKRLYVGPLQMFILLGPAFEARIVGLRTGSEFYP